MALIFYQPLPPGNKVVVYVSRMNPNYVVTQQAFEENNMALVCAIPSELRVILLPVAAHSSFHIYVKTKQFNMCFLYYYSSDNMIGN